MISTCLTLSLLAASAPDPAAWSETSIRPAAIGAHLRYLADDLLEGRGTATRGHELAARYVAAQFEALGLEPGGDAGSWFQQVPLRQSQIDESNSSLRLVGGGRTRELKADDFVLAADSLRERSDVTGAVVFVGYGISAPELGHDDYAGIDVRGKLVAVLAGAPASFPNDQRAYYSSRDVKSERAVAHGAIGMLGILTPEEEQRYPFARIAGAVRAGSMHWLEDGDRPHGVWEALRANGILGRSGVEALFEGSPRKLAQVFEDAAKKAKPGKSNSFALPVEVQIHTETKHTRVQSPNVIGIVRGSDAALAQEFVVISAHLDHLGIGREVNGDTIYNGAYDNASGSAGMIEIARAFATIERRPRRSIVFLATTGEEKGLLGADYFARRPTVPKTGIVADLNLDMFLTLFPVRDVIAFGAEHSTLGDVLKRVAPALGLETSPDPFPQEVLFIRADHYAFVRQGVPALSLSCGLKSSDASIDSAARFQNFLVKVYHSPQDDMSQSFDLPSAAKIARLYFLMAYDVADTVERPRFTPGDFFGARFAH